MFAALLLAVMLSAPAAAAGCADEARAAFSAADSLGDGQASPEPSDTDPCEDGCGPCVHCQCHHGGASIAAEAMLSESLQTDRARHVLAEASAPRSNLTFGLKRPPRA
ncbi:MAG: hypothetical protein Q8Q88_01245 [Phenylobacterium sp.]|uniref:hypothetical protein n=1 Tax=Phenylobacterium sp. TaxID=1871053 RepID=UPI0027353FA3|nr:hypothetical protein [Phenylobacterium sp.]MDP3745650.1 hypothetical protein [Phenylobacterium sp.]